jgi:hypothetical protein
MEWWDNRDKELKRILEKLQQIRSGEETPEQETPEQEAPKAPEAEQVKLQTKTVKIIKASPARKKSAPTYKAAAVPVRVITAEAFIEPRNERSIQSKISKVINGEAPVSQSVLMKRVIQSYGITRAGTRMQTHFQTLLQEMNLRTTVQDGTVFYWNADQNPDAYMIYRVCGEDESHRDPKDVPVQEVANAIYVVLYEQISMSREDLLRETAGKLGYARVSNVVLSMLELGIQYAQDQGGITMGASGTYVLSNGGTARAEAVLQSF